MSTRDRGPLDPEGLTQVDLTGVTQLAQAAMNPETISRIANEMFRAIGPEAGMPRNGSMPGPGGLPSSGQDVFGNGMESFLVPMSTQAADPSVTGMLTNTSGVIPGWAFGAPPTSSDPAFYFLQSATPPNPPPAARATAPVLFPNMSASPGIFDAGSLRKQFPILEEKVNGKRLVWLDNAATTQKPRAVIERLTRFYERDNSNIHRAAHALAGRATDAYEAARESARRFVNAGSTREIIFVRGATEGINLIAQSWGRRHLSAGDEILLTVLEHHSNIVPWQMLAAEMGATLRVAPVDDRGQIQLEAFERLLSARTKLVSFAHVSNALGTVLPIQQMTAMAHRVGARVMVDGAQAVSHLPIDVQAIGCDWYVFSGHKVFAPTGIGVVRGSPEVLDASPPWQGGGNMIADVTFEKTMYQAAPLRFEAGTGSIADAVGLGAALDWLSAIGLANVATYEHNLLEYGTRRLLDVPGVRLIGTAAEKAGVLSFVLDGYRTEEVGAALDREGIAVRSGHHCAQPALRRMGVETSVRPSLALYNTREDIDAMIDVLRRLQSGRTR